MPGRTLHESKPTELLRSFLDDANARSSKLAGLWPRAVLRICELDSPAHLDTATNSGMPIPSPRTAGRGLGRGAFPFVANAKDAPGFALPGNEVSTTIRSKI